jgi:hypothetical protein
MTQQTLTQAMQTEEIRRALGGLIGCPCGGWPETLQALRQLSDALPYREMRDYTLVDILDAALVLNHADRYAWRDDAATASARRDRELLADWRARHA